MNAKSSRGAATAHWQTLRAPTGDPVKAYNSLRDRLIELRLIELNSAPEKDMWEIDKVIDLLAKAQLAAKAAHGLIGNNPIED